MALYWTLLIGGLWLFVEFADEVYEKDGFFFDKPILTWFHGLIDPTLTKLAMALSTVGDFPAMLGVALLMVIILWFISRRESLFFLASMGGAALIMGITKVALARPRPELFPDVHYWQTASPSFPSGHATGSAALALTLVLLMRHLWPRWQLLVGIVAGLFSLLVCASRLYLQVHYPSDILAGVALGVGWVLGVNFIYDIYLHDEDVTDVLLRLPKEVVAAYRSDADAKGVPDNQVVSEILQQHYQVAAAPIKDLPTVQDFTRRTRKRRSPR